MSEDVINVFVYGTLKYGQENHHLLKDRTGTAGHVTGFILYDLGWCPAVTQGSGIVYGELYTIDEETLTALDILEEIPSWYHRHMTPVALDSGEVKNAWIYVLPKAPEGQIVRSGRWR